MEEKGNHRKGRGFAIGLALGIPLGIPIGLVMDNLAVGPVIGIAIGTGLGIAMERSYRNREETETTEFLRKKKIVRILIAGLLAAVLIALTILYLIA